MLVFSMVSKSDKCKVLQGFSLEFAIKLMAFTKRTLAFLSERSERNVTIHVTFERGSTAA